MRRAVRAVIILVAAGLLVLGGMEIGLEVVRHRLQSADMNDWHFVLGAVLSVAALLLLAFCNRLAERLTGDFEE